MKPPLLRRFPELEIPWRSLGAFPTPVERAPSLGERVWVKRDDLSGGAGYGGNKVRKLELVLADALARGRRTLLTIGGTGSNHVLATAIYGRNLGFSAVHAVLFPQPPTEDVERKARAYRDLSVRSTRAWGKPFVPFAFAARVGAALGGGSLPYVIGPGASSPLGTIGYVNAALELAEQIQAGELPRPAAVYVPLGSGGTVAGLLVGFRLAGLPIRVRAVRVVPPPWVSPGSAARLATRAARLLDEAGAPTGDFTFSPGDLDDVRDQLGPGYGAATPAAEEAVARAAGAGIPAETTYSGKALAALLAAQRDDRDGGRDVLFWSTYSRYPASAS